MASHPTLPPPLEGWLRRKFDSKAGSDWRFFRLTVALTPGSTRTLRFEYRHNNTEGQAFTMVFASIPTRDIQIELDDESLASFASGSPGESLAGARPIVNHAPSSYKKVTLMWSGVRSAAVLERVPQCVFLAQWLASQGCVIVGLSEAQTAAAVAAAALIGPPPVIVSSRPVLSSPPQPVRSTAASQAASPESSQGSPLPAAAAATALAAVPSPVTAPEAAAAPPAPVPAPAPMPPVHVPVPVVLPPVSSHPVSPKAASAPAAAAAPRVPDRRHRGRRPDNARQAI